MKEKSHNRGGARPGAGRKKIENKKTQHTISLPRGLMAEFKAVSSDHNNDIAKYIHSQIVQGDRLAIERKNVLLAIFHGPQDARVGFPAWLIGERQQCALESLMAENLVAEKIIGYYSLTEAGKKIVEKLHKT